MTTAARNVERRRALVTGGASGIGRACAERLAAGGVEVITGDISPGADVHLDVASSESIIEAAWEVGPVDILVNSAGVVGPNKLLELTTPQEWQRTFEVNVFGTAAMCRATVPGMRERGWGRIVNMASMAGKDGNPAMSVYSASKAAVIGLTKSLGKELATSGVLVNAVAPAVIATPMNADMTPAVLDALTSLIPMKRFGRPAEVADLVFWLCSDQCSFSTGAVYDISGGRATY